MRAVTLQPGGRRPGRADRHPDDPGLPRRPRRPRPPRGHRARLVTRHEPRHGVDGRLHDGDRAVGRGWWRGPRRAARRAGSADGRGDADQPLDARALREAHGRPARGGPRGRRAGLHGRRQPECHPGQVPARRGRLRRHALQHPQDLLHAARRRGSRGRAGGRRREAALVPARAACRPRRRMGRSASSGRTSGRRRSGACAPTRAAPASTCARTPISGPTAGPAWSRSARTPCWPPTT